MIKWNLIVDVALCENCHNCTLAAKDEHVGNDFTGYAAPQPIRGHDWIRIERKVRGEAPMVDAAYLPTMCNHCDNAPCIKAAGADVIRKRDDGIVIIDPVKSRGRRDLVAACPYGAIVWNETLEIPQAWIFDAHLIDAGWKEPRCAQVCPTGAIRSVKCSDAEMRAKVQDEMLQVLGKDLGTKPRVYYKNLDRFTKCFIGGSVVASMEGVIECVAGAAVVVRKDGKVVSESTTDTFGDFKCDGFDPESGAYSVEVAHPQHGVVTGKAVLGESVYLGALRLATVDADPRVQNSEEDGAQEARASMDRRAGQ